jgi:hypothetical protein
MLVESVRAEDLKAEIIDTETGDALPRVVLPEALHGNVEIRSLKIRS